MNKKLDIKVVEAADSLYAKQPKVYPREIDGRFQRLRVASVFWLLGMFYLFPWINFSGHQAVLFDLPARKFHIFGLTFWPQDFFLLTMLLVIAAVTLFFFTALVGRVWCGFACPQTVWTEVFLWSERWIEGNRNQRIKLDAGPWNRNKIVRKTSKQFVWITFSLWTGFTFVGFFTPIRELAHSVFASTLGGWETFWILFYGFATYGNAGFLREQVCKYMCPYARFQSAMFDRDTLIISYDVARGEPRGHRKRSHIPRVPAIGSPAAALAINEPSVFGLVEEAKDTLGDCIDCLACVQVCPTGIDIREGLQIECIACAACIDACDAVMDKMGYARGLIKYTTENMLDGKPQRVLRPRTVIYAAGLASIILAFVWAVAARSPVIIEVLRDRNSLYRSVGNESIENSYNVKLVNKTDAPVMLKVVPQTDIALRVIGNASVTLEPEEVYSLPLTLRADTGSSFGRTPIVLQVEDSTGTVLAHSKSQFFAPEKP